MILTRRDVVYDSQWQKVRESVMSIAEGTERGQKYIDGEISPNSSYSQPGFKKDATAGSYPQPDPASSIKQLLTNHIRRDYNQAVIDRYHQENRESHNQIQEDTYRISAEEYRRDNTSYNHVQKPSYVESGRGSLAEQIHTKLSRDPPSSQPEPVRREFSQPEPVRREFGQSEPVRREFGQSEPVRREFGQSEPIRRDISSGGKADLDLKKFDVAEENLSDEKSKEDLISKIVESQIAGHRFRDPHALFSPQEADKHDDINSDTVAPVDTEPERPTDTYPNTVPPSPDTETSNTKTPEIPQDYHSNSAPTQSNVTTQSTSSPVKSDEFQTPSSLPSPSSAPASNASQLSIALSPSNSYHSSQASPRDRYSNPEYLPSPSPRQIYSGLPGISPGSSHNHSGSESIERALESSFEVNSYRPSEKDEHGNFIYHCHLCSYSGTSRFHFNAHMNSHFEHNCPHCDYSSRTEGRLKRHIKDFHSEQPPESFAGNKTVRSPVMPGRQKLYRCKQCEFVSPTKVEFWEHARTHIKDDKILQCPKCPFVTEYKHHLEYHLRNHFGSKPFKCPKCNYSCVNKSMLNSHMKSHTNIYQYRCADCSYASKYCHSLKLHLRKYNHKPATVLSLDGTPLDEGEQFPPKRGPPRGPRGPRKEKQMPLMLNPNLMGMARPPMSMPTPQMAMNGMIPGPYWPMMQMPNGLQAPPALMNLNMSKMVQNAIQASGIHVKQEPGVIKCSLCEFVGESQDDLSNHVVKVHAAENQDLFNMFGISQEALMDEHMRKMQALAGHQNGREINQQLHVQTSAAQMERSGVSPRSWPPQKVGSLPNLHQSPHQGAEGGVMDLTRRPNSNGHHNAGMKPGEVNMSNGEAPLDLSAPVRKSPDEEFASQEYRMNELKRPYSREAMNDASATGSPQSNSNDGEIQPRKRSRKGKAFKLDTLCLKLQEQSGDGSMSVDSIDDSDGEGNLMIADVSQDASENGEHQEKEASPDIDDIHNSLSQLNSEEQGNTQGASLHPKYRYLKSHGKDGDEDENANGKKNVTENGEDTASVEEDAKAVNFAQREQENYPEVQQAQEAVLTNQHMGRMLAQKGFPYECTFCDIMFRDCVMYTMHMGYHGYSDPFKCNMCGHQAKDKVAFFLHIARVPHE